MKKALNPVGLKRICIGCGVRFYDLNKRPIICPSCGNEFTGDIKVKSRRGRLPADDKKLEPQKSAAVNENEDEILVEDEELEVVSLEDVEEDNGDDEDDAIELDAEDIDLPDFEDDDVEDDLEEDPLLEEEES